MLVLLVLVCCGCAAPPRGPAAPLAREQFDSALAPALDAAAARQTVVDFVTAYADSPTEGPGALAALIAGDPLAAWVRWLSVKHREFTGSINGVADVRDVEFIGSLQERRVTTAQVGLSASVVFRFEPQGAQAFKRTRILDGPVRLLQTDTGSFRVVDLLRDGVPMSDGIQLFQGEERTEGGVTVTLHSLFMFAPNWQFNLEIHNGGRRPLELVEHATGLFVRQGERFDRLDGVLTGSLVALAPGESIDGIIAFEMQDAAQGRTLTLAYHAGGDELQFAFPLDDLVTIVPPPPEAPGEIAA